MKRTVPALFTLAAALLQCLLIFFIFSSPAEACTHGKNDYNFAELYARHRFRRALLSGLNFNEPVYRYANGRFGKGGWIFDGKRKLIRLGFLPLRRAIPSFHSPLPLKVSTVSGQPSRIKKLSLLYSVIEWSESGHKFSAVKEALRLQGDAFDINRAALFPYIDKARLLKPGPEQKRLKKMMKYSRTYAFIVFWALAVPADKAGKPWVSRFIGVLVTPCDGLGIYENKKDMRKAGRR